MQQRFVSDVSHELRTPLTTIRMAADVLFESRQSLTAETARSAELLQNQLDRFEALLGDLLEISRFDAGAAKLESDSVDVATLVQRVIDGTEPLAQSHNLRVRFASYERPCNVVCDARRIERIVRNLLDNAIEHGNEKGVLVELAGDADVVSLTVRDGVGLRPGEAGLVFNRLGVQIPLEQGQQAELAWDSRSHWKMPLTVGGWRRGESQASGVLPPGMGAVTHACSRCPTRCRVATTRPIPPMMPTSAN